MIRLLAAYLATCVTMVGMDAVWITVTGPVLYRPALHAVLSDGFRPIPAVLFYLVYAAGVTALAALPAGRRWTGAAWRGALLGLVAYATYDLTNQATLKTWPVTVTIVDMGWGTFLTACVATVGYLAASRFGRG